MLKIERFVCGPLENNVYVLLGEDSPECAVVDPAMESGEVIDYVRQHELQVRYILLTHAHFDHAFPLAEFKREFDAAVALHPADLPLLRKLAESAATWGFVGGEAPPEPDLMLEHGQRLTLAGQAIEVRHTPGHSPGQVAFLYPGNAVVGDTLFWRGIGRYDLPGSDYHALMKSIKEQLYTLPAETVVWPGHGPETTIGEERRLNPHVGEGARFLPNL